MTKKEFNSKLTQHVYNRGKNKRYALYFDYKSLQDEDGYYFGGFKYMVKGHVRDLTIQQLRSIMYDWVTEKIPSPPWYVEYRYAETDEMRFKVAIVG